MTYTELGPETTPFVANDAVARCIEACLRCAEACEACADACLLEPDTLRLAYRLRSELGCAGACRATAQALRRSSIDDDDPALAQVSACAEVCRIAAETAQRYAVTHQACQTCVDACQACYEACLELIED